MDKKEQTFAQMIKEQKSTIYTVCYMFSKDQDEVNDLFQETLVNLWRGFDGFEGRSDVKTWVYRVALNTCITLDRHRRRRPEILFQLFQPASATLRPRHRTPMARRPVVR